MNPFFEEAKKIANEMRDIRRDIHKHPETGMKETRTSGIAADYLEKLGLSVQTGVGGTGVAAVLYGRKKGKTIAIRADMDALPLEDKKKVPYASCNKGIAHACGHDAHTAMLLGTAKILCKFSDSLNGNVKFIFQPSEEKTPGGALPMINDGVLENPRVDGIFALHLNPEQPEGMIMLRPGYSTVSSAGFVLKLTGRGGHVAFPHKAVDPIIMAAECISASQNIISRRTDPLEPVLLSFSSIHGGTASNVIPESVTLKGTIRAFSPQSIERLIKLFKKTVKAVADMNEGSYDLNITKGYPSVFNNPNMVKSFIKSAAKITGPDSIAKDPPLFMGGEDMSYFLERVPGVFWFLGTGNEEKGFIHPLHSPMFDFNEDIMPLGAAVNAQAAADFLNHNPA